MSQMATCFPVAATKSKIELPMNPDLCHPVHNEYRWAGMAEAKQLLSGWFKPFLHRVRDLLTLRN